MNMFLINLLYVYLSSLSIYLLSIIYMYIYIYIYIYIYVYIYIYIYIYICQTFLKSKYRVKWKMDVKIFQNIKPPTPTPHALLPQYN